MAQLNKAKSSLYNLFELVLSFVILSYYNIGQGFLAFLYSSKIKVQFFITTLV